nr:hypothetical protein [Nitratireductor aquibiodomus]
MVDVLSGFGAFVVACDLEEATCLLTVLERPSASICWTTARSKRRSGASAMGAFRMP